MKAIPALFISIVILATAGCTKNGTKENPITLDSFEAAKVQITSRDSAGIHGGFTAYNGSEYIITSADISITVDGDTREFRCRAGVTASTPGGYVFLPEYVRPKSEGHLELDAGSFLKDDKDGFSKYNKAKWLVTKIQGYKK